LSAFSSIRSTRVLYSTRTHYL
jgi:CTP synthase (UTP-ammonia lyase)